jgi:hypothetical protein
VRLPGSPRTKETESVFSQKILQRPKRLFGGMLHAPCHEIRFSRAVLSDGIEIARLKSGASGIAERCVSQDPRAATRNRVARIHQVVRGAPHAVSISCSFEKKSLHCTIGTKKSGRKETAASRSSPNLRPSAGVLILSTPSRRVSPQE